MLNIKTIGSLIKLHVCKQIFKKQTKTLNYAELGIRLQNTTF